MPSPRTSLTIGIDARGATEVPAGRGRVVRELLRELARREDPHRYVCYGRQPWEEPLDDRFEWRCRALPIGPWHAWVAADARKRCDVFLATDSYVTVLLNRTPTVAVVYDLMAFDRRTSPNRLSMVVEHSTLGLAVRRARALICISAATRAALIERCPAAEPKATVALLAASPALAMPSPEEAEGLPAPGFLLAVGTLEPRKNLPRLVEAFAALPVETQRAHPLVVVGALGWRTGPTLEALRSLGDRCVMLGYVSDAALAELYRRCAVFCYPSLGEGFGLPVLEAMSVGAVVLTSDVSSLPEVAGDAAAYVDPLSVQSITAALAELLASPQRRQELSDRARPRAQQFSWSRTAAEVLAVLESAADGTQPLIES